jgi:hypothetical protein
MRCRRRRCSSEVLLCSSEVLLLLLLLPLLEGLILGLAVTAGAAGRIKSVVCVFGPEEVL